MRAGPRSILQVTITRPRSGANQSGVSRVPVRRQPQMAGVNAAGKDLEGRDLARTASSTSIGTRRRWTQLPAMARSARPTMVLKKPCATTSTSWPAVGQLGQLASGLSARHLASARFSWCVMVEPATTRSALTPPQMRRLSLNHFGPVRRRQRRLDEELVLAKALPAATARAVSIERNRVEAMMKPARSAASTCPSGGLWPFQQAALLVVGPPLAIFVSAEHALARQRRLAMAGQDHRARPVGRLFELDELGVSHALGSHHVPAAAYALHPPATPGRGPAPNGPALQGRSRPPARIPPAHGTAISRRQLSRASPRRSPPPPVAGRRRHRVARVGVESGRDDDQVRRERVDRGHHPFERAPPDLARRAGRRPCVSDVADAALPARRCRDSGHWWMEAKNSPGPLRPVPGCRCRGGRRSRPPRPAPKPSACAASAAMATVENRQKPIGARARRGGRAGARRRRPASPHPAATRCTAAATAPAARIPQTASPGESHVSGSSGRRPAAGSAASSAAR